MVKAGLGLSTRLQPASAAREAAEQALAPLGGQRPDAALVLATAAWGSGASPGLIGDVAEELDAAALAGASVEGLLGAGREIQNEPALGVLAVSGIAAESFLWEELAGQEARAGAELETALARPVDSSDLLLLFADPLDVAPRPLLDGLHGSVGPLCIAGLGAAEPAGGRAMVWGDGCVATRACAGLLLRLRKPPTLAVTSGCRLRARPMPVTRRRGSWVLGLGGRPALDVLLESLPEPLREDPERAIGSLLVALLPEGESAAPGEPGPPDTLALRNVTGIDRGNRSFALPESVPPGRQLAFASLDGAAAREDLGRQLDRVAASLSAFGCYLSCRSRGAGVFEHAGVESGYLERALGDLPLLGAMGPYQLAPAGAGVGPSPAARAGAGTLLHTYSGVLVLVGG